MIKTLEVSLGEVGELSLLNPSQVGVPVVEPGVVLATGYYTEQTTQQLYYYDAVNDQWYYVTAAGLLYPLAISWKPSPSPKIDLVAGDILRFNLTFKYYGPEQVGRKFYAAIGGNNKSGGFPEWSGYNTTKLIDIPAKTTPTLITGQYIDVEIPSGEPFWGHHGEDGAAFCKIMDGFTLTEGEDCTPYYYDVCHIIPAAGEFTSFGITKFEKV
ncbi:unnamed protein product [marine sediment metagenome]|uniref:Uncharacterized protein n=1 Tax=marine sediment metagenome TaxID=412755 RepID=X1JTH9_9ZZZZ